MSKQGLVWSEPFRVRAGDVRPGGGLRLPVLCDWLQEAAASHAAALGFGSEDLRAQGLTWVLSRLSLSVRRWPVWRDEVTVTTWPSGVLRLWALREFRVSDARGGEVAVATSGWLILKVAARRPVRPPAEVAGAGSLAPPRVLDDPFEELAFPVETSGNETEYRVGRYDLDTNAHANNVAILRWLLEGAPAQAEDGPLDLAVEFRGECFEGELLSSRGEAHGGVLRRALVRKDDGREVARCGIRTSTY